MSKPTRKQLLKVVEQCQTLFGDIEAVSANDRATDRADRLHRLTREGFNLCLSARSEEPPQ